MKETFDSEFLLVVSFESSFKTRCAFLKPVWIKF